MTKTGLVDILGLVFDEARDSIWSSMASLSAVLIHGWTFGAGFRFGIGLLCALRFAKGKVSGKVAWKGMGSSHWNSASYGISEMFTDMVCCIDGTDQAPLEASFTFMRYTCTKNEICVESHSKVKSSLFVFNIK